MIFDPERHGSAWLGTRPGREFAGLCEELGIGLLVLDELNCPDPGPLPTVSINRRAMILFTSGTTSRPKGVVSTHANIQAQVETLVQEWEWQADDRTPLFLPLHHVHGIVNVLTCALWSGARVEPFPSFLIDEILAGVAAGAYTVFMAVPTIYVKLIQQLHNMDPAACAVVGIEDGTWGEAVAAAVVLGEGASLDLPARRAWAGSRLSSYKLPRHLKILASLPRNAMGKVTKTAVKDLF